MTRFVKGVFQVAAVAGMLLSAGQSNAGRYEELTTWAATGPKARVVAATFFGGNGCEEFLAGGQLANGQIVAIGNAWGPDFPASSKARVLGKGSHTGSNPFKVDKKGTNLVYTCDTAGIVVLHAKDLSGVANAVRLDWGVGRFTTGQIVDGGKSILVAGVGGPGVASVIPKATAGSVFLVKIDGKTLDIVAAVVLDVAADPKADPATSTLPDRLYVDSTGSIVVPAATGAYRVSADLNTSARIEGIKGETGTAGVRGVDPNDGSIYFGGDRNTNTGKEPWRQPYLYKFDKDGKRAERQGKPWALWEWPPKSLRDGKSPGQGQVSDSSPRNGIVLANGDLLISGWSDGGNSVFTGQPTDLARGTGAAASPFSVWGMKNANSIGYLMLIDGKSLDMKAWTLWVSYCPDTFPLSRNRGAPNFASIDTICLLADGAVGLSGSAATGLISTPNAFYQHGKSDQKYGGHTATIFSRDFKHLLFSSYMPGNDSVHVAPTRDGMLILGRSRGDDGRQPTPVTTPVINAVQKEKKGDFDGHIVLLELPHE